MATFFCESSMIDRWISHECTLKKIEKGIKTRIRACYQVFLSSSISLSLDHLKYPNLHQKIKAQVGEYLLFLNGAIWGVYVFQST